MQLIKVSIVNVLFMDQDLVVNVLIKHKKQTGKEMAVFVKQLSIIHNGKFNQIIPDFIN